MAYFLKKSNAKKGVYLQIYETYRNKEKKETSHRAVKSIGYVSELISEKMYPSPFLRASHMFFAQFRPLSATWTVFPAMPQGTYRSKQCPTRARFSTMQ